MFQNGNSPQTRGFDYFADLADGRTGAESGVVINGHDEIADTTEIAIHPQGTTVDINQSALFATPSTVQVASTSNSDAAGGGGALTVRLFGNDATGAPTFDDITLTGQAPVTSLASFSSIHVALVVAWDGAGTINIGHIWVGSGAFALGVPAVPFLSMQAGSNKSATAYYVVPSNQRLVFSQITLSCIASANRTVEVELETSSDGLRWIEQASFHIQSGAIWQGRITSAAIVPQQTHVRLTSLSSGSGTRITAILGAVLR